MPTLCAGEAQRVKPAGRARAVAGREASGPGRGAAPVTERRARFRRARSGVRPVRLLALPPVRAGVAGGRVRPGARSGMSELRSPPGRRGGEPPQSLCRTGSLAGREASGPGTRTASHAQPRHRPRLPRRVLQPGGVVAVPNVRQRVAARTQRAPSGGQLSRLPWHMTRTRAWLRYSGQALAVCRAPGAGTRRAAARYSGARLALRRPLGRAGRSFHGPPRQRGKTVPREFEMVLPGTAGRARSIRCRCL